MSKSKDNAKGKVKGLGSKKVQKVVTIVKAKGEPDEVIINPKSPVTIKGLKKAQSELNKADLIDDNNAELEQNVPGIKSKKLPTRAQIRITPKVPKLR